MSEETPVQGTPIEDTLVASALPADARFAASLASGRSRFDIDQFEGPLDLLLHLVKKSEVDLADIPVASITEQYLAYLDLMRELNLDVAGEFLVMAATLQLVKSRMLLPSLEVEEGEEPDPRADLIRQLLEYSRFRDASAELAERPRLLRDVFVRKENAEGLEPETDEVAEIKVTLWQLMSAFQRVLKRAEPTPIHEVALESVRVRDRIESVLKTLSVARTVTFDSLFDESSSRVFVIATFLALLELGKLGAIDAVQAERFGEIEIKLLVDDVSDVRIELEDEYEGSVLPFQPDAGA